MKALLKFRPDLRACALEDRLAPAISNLGTIVLTTGGYVLVTAFPGVATYPGGSPGGTAIPTSFVVTGSGGISSLQPGNGTGIPGLAATAPIGSNGAASGTIVVGSGANDAGTPNIPLVTRNTIANDALNPLPIIGRVSGERSAVLPPDLVYRGGLPVTATVGFSPEGPGQRAEPEPAQGNVDPLPLRLQRRPNRLLSGHSGNLIRSHADRAP